MVDVLQKRLACESIKKRQKGCIDCKEITSQSRPPGLNQDVACSVGWPLGSRLQCMRTGAEHPANQVLSDDVLAAHALSIRWYEANQVSNCLANRSDFRPYLVPGLAGPNAKQYMPCTVLHVYDHGGDLERKTHKAGRPKSGHR